MKFLILTLLTTVSLNTTSAFAEGYIDTNQKQGFGTQIKPREGTRGDCIGNNCTSVQKRHEYQSEKETVGGYNWGTLNNGTAVFFPTKVEEENGSFIITDGVNKCYFLPPKSRGIVDNEDFLRQLLLKKITGYCIPGSDIDLDPSKHYLWIYYTKFKSKIPHNNLQVFVNRFLDKKPTAIAWKSYPMNDIALGVNGSVTTLTVSLRTRLPDKVLEYCQAYIPKIYKSSRTYMYKKYEDFLTLFNDLENKTVQLICNIDEQNLNTNSPDYSNWENVLSVLPVQNNLSKSRNEK